MATRDVREILLKFTGKETVAAEAIKGSKGVNKLGDSLDEAARDARQLDRALDDTHRSITTVLAALAKDPGDIGLRKQLRALNRESRSLKKIRADFMDLGDDSASGFAARFVARVGPLLASAPIHPALIGIAVAAAPGVAAVLGGAVLAGLSGGVVAAGIAAAAQDNRVKREASRLGDILGEVMRESTASFVPATIGAIGVVRAEIGKLGPALKRVGDQGAAFVAPLTRGVTNLVRNALPGIESALKKSGPVIYALERGLATLGTGVGKMLNSIADGAAGAGLAVSDFLRVAAVGVGVLGKTVGFLSKAFAAIRFATAFDKNAVMAEVATGAVQAAAYEAELQKLIDGLSGYGDASEAAAVDTRTLAEQQRDATAAAQSQFGAITSLESAIDDARAAMKENGKTHDANTAKGRANRDALQQLAGAATAAYDETVKLSGSQGEAQRVMDRSYKAFLRTAEGMGYTRDEAKRLARQFGLIQPVKQIKVTTPGMSAAQIGAKNLQAALGRIKNKKVTIDIIQRLSTRGVRVAGVTGAGGFTARAHGGPVGPGRDYLVGEEGPELVRFPRAGTVIPAAPTRQAMSGGGTTRVVFDVTGADEDFKRWIRKMVRVDGGGDVQAAFGR